MNKQNDIKAVILAAGKGKRLGSEETGIAKAMREAAGKPLLSWVLSALDFISPKDTVIVVGFKKQTIIEAFPGCIFAEQTEQLGTGHAAACAAALLNGWEGSVLICCGDMPLIEKSTYEALCQTHRLSGYACTILTCVYPDCLPYGRIVTARDGSFKGIVEQKDCTPQEDAIREYNSGVYVFSAPILAEALALLKNDNAQGEYYLTDVPGIIRLSGHSIGTYKMESADELLGVNTIEDLRKVEDILLKKRHNSKI
ncbi:MAG: NTP transferase domain-containing protein [Clostridiales bacterium]|nr:NTP transferase domain-containing protein [Clostridiales bacterium]